MHRERLMALFMEGGLAGMGKDAVVELIVSYAAPRKDPRALSRALLRRYSGIREMFDAPEDELKSLGRLGEGEAAFIRLVKDIAGAYLRDSVIGRDAAGCREGLLDYLRMTLSGERVEKFLAVYLSRNGEVLAIEVLHEGTINQTVVYPRKAIERAFRHDAGQVIFIHNHPSGDPTPSSVDRQLMKVLDRAAAAVDLVVQDHLIIGRNAHFSAVEQGWKMGFPAHHRAASP